MDKKTDSEDRQWRQLLCRLEEEISSLDPSEKVWMAPRLLRIAESQRQLHLLFQKAEGEEQCSVCSGECCGCGKNHLTLVNLLCYLVSGIPIPTPDFTLTCPFLGDAGCRHEVERRPFNCVTFLCEKVEGRLEPSGKETFYRLESELRLLYEEFDKRYAGSSLRGIFIRSASLGERTLLDRPESL